MALIDALQAAERWPGKRVLLPRAEEGRTELGEALRGAGATVDEVIAYRTVAVPPAEVAAAWRSAAPDAVVVASPSSARALIAGVGAEPLCALQFVAAIGATTLETLEGLGVRAHVPHTASFEAVAALVAQHLQVPAVDTLKTNHLSGSPREFRHEEGGAS
jgi:uroporphyrinogen-III synthase